MDPKTGQGLLAKKLINAEQYAKLCGEERGGPGSGRHPYAGAIIDKDKHNSFAQQHYVAAAEAKERGDKQAEKLHSDAASAHMKAGQSGKVEDSKAAVVATKAAVRAGKDRGFADIADEFSAVKSFAEMVAAFEAVGPVDEVRGGPGSGRHPEGGKNEEGDNIAKGFAELDKQEEAHGIKKGDTVALHSSGEHAKVHSVSGNTLSIVKSNGSAASVHAAHVTKK